MGEVVELFPEMPVNEDIGCMGYMVADIDAGEGSVLFHPEFIVDDPLFRADLLKDWIGSLEHLYNEALTEMRGGE